MPTGDVIFSRLRAATESELDVLSKILEETRSGDREVDVVKLSAALRSAGGNSFANLFRDAHELAYRELLKDVMGVAAASAKWRTVEAPDSALDEWIEEYVWLATLAANRPDRETLSPPERAALQEAAESALRGVPPPAGLKAEQVGGLAALGAGAIAGLAFSVPALPFALVYVAIKWSSPATKKTLPSAMMLIQVRKRAEIEARLREEIAP